jgi:hypothetical protein
MAEEWPIAVSGTPPFAAPGQHEHVLGLRSALTALGIVVGVAAVVCMVSVGAGAEADLLLATPGTACLVP